MRFISWTFCVAHFVGFTFSSPLHRPKYVLRETTSSCSLTSTAVSTNEVQASIIQQQEWNLCSYKSILSQAHGNCSSVGQNSMTPFLTTASTTDSGTTHTETFIATYLTQYATLTTKSLVTTTDCSGVSSTFYVGELGQVWSKWGISSNNMALPTEPPPPPVCTRCRGDEQPMNSTTVFGGSSQHSTATPVNPNIPDVHPHPSSSTPQSPVGQATASSSSVSAVSPSTASNSPTSAIGEAPSSHTSQAGGNGPLHSVSSSSNVGVPPISSSAQSLPVTSSRISSAAGSTQSAPTQLPGTAPSITSSVIIPSQVSSAVASRSSGQVQSPSTAGTSPAPSSAGTISLSSELTSPALASSFLIAPSGSQGASTITSPLVSGTSKPNSDPGSSVVSSGPATVSVTPSKSPTAGTQSIVPSSRDSSSRSVPSSLGSSTQSPGTSNLQQSASPTGQPSSSPTGSTQEETNAPSSASVIASSTSRVLTSGASTSGISASDASTLSDSSLPTPSSTNDSPSSLKSSVSPSGSSKNKESSSDASSQIATVTTSGTITISPSASQRTSLTPPGSLTLPTVSSTPSAPIKDSTSLNPSSIPSRTGNAPSPTSESGMTILPITLSDGRITTTEASLSMPSGWPFSEGPVPSETVDPSGTEASASARSLETMVNDVLPLFVDWKKAPDDQKVIGNLLNKLGNIENFASSLWGRLKKGGGGGPEDDGKCTDTNIFTLIVKAVKCVTSKAKDMKSKISAKNIDIDIDVKMLGGLVQGGGGPNNPSGSKTGSITSSTSSCSTRTASACSTQCVAGASCQTACTSTYTGCSATSTGTASTVTLAPGISVKGFVDTKYTGNDTIPEKEADEIYEMVYSFIQSEQPEPTTFELTKEPPHPQSTSTAPPKPTSTQLSDSQLKCNDGRTDQGNTEFWMEVRSMELARDMFCDYMVEKKYESPGKSLTYNWSGHLDDPIEVSAISHDEKNCPKLNFSGKEADENKKKCKEYLDETIHNCSLNSKEKKHWKLGGVYKRDCVEWGIKRDTWRSKEDIKTDDSYTPPQICKEYTDCKCPSDRSNRVCANAGVGPGRCSCLK